MKKIIFLFTALLLISCKDEAYKPKDLHLITHDELVEMVREGRFPSGDHTVIKNEKGEIIPRDSVMKIPNLSDDWTLDMYINDDFELVEMVLRPATGEDQRFKERLRDEVQPQASSEPEFVEIDCSRQAEILDEIYERDQGMRSGNGSIDRETDQQNLVMVVNLIDQCGMPGLANVNERQMSAIWVVFQHADNSVRKKYLPVLEKAAENGDLSKSQIAMMRDRILMDDGEPQEYGTQVEERNGQWVLYNLKSPEYVNLRRASVGLGPIEEYLRRWEIKFDVKQIKE